MDARLNAQARLDGAADRARVEGWCPLCGRPLAIDATNRHCVYCMERMKKLFAPDMPVPLLLEVTGAGYPVEPPAVPFVCYLETRGLTTQSFNGLSPEKREEIFKDYEALVKFGVPAVEDVRDGEPRWMDLGCFGVALGSWLLTALLGAALGAVLVWALDR